MRLVVLVGIVTGLTLGSAGQAGAAVLYDQLPMGDFTTSSFTSHDFRDDTLDAQGADDFTITDGQVWTLQRVQVAGRAGRAAPPEAAIVVLYENDAGVPGAPVFSQSGIALQDADCVAADRCNFTASLSGAPRLVPGTYWASVQTSGANEWYWHLYTADTAFAQPAVWRNPGAGLQPPHACTTFRPVTECGASDADGEDFVFALSGALIDSRFGSPEFTAKRLRLFANVSLPAAGTVAIAGKGVKRSTREVAAGAQRVRVKLKPRVIDRLRSGRKARLRVRLTFTATGGDAYTQRDPVKLVPAGRPAALRLGA